jgi:BMFP domain-containing protein YqiC
MKINPKNIDEAVSKLKELLPGDINDFKNTSEEKLKLVLTAMLQKLEMVSREEYEIQTEVLQRTRQRLEQLEQRIAELEKN